MRKEGLISIRALLAEGDGYNILAADIADNISIRALLAEGDPEHSLSNQGVRISIRALLAEGDGKVEQ